MQRGDILFGGISVDEKFTNAKDTSTAQLLK